MLHFAEFRLDPAALQIFRDDVPLDAAPQVVEVLAYLINSRDRIVGRQELLDRFWPRAGTGGDAALNTCIRRIRTLLGDDADAPRFIQTRPRSGYRFIATFADTATAPPARRRKAGRLAAIGGVLTTMAIGGAVWAHGAMFPTRHHVAIEPVEGLCEYVLFPKFNAGLRESFVAEVSHKLPAGYSVVSGEGRADLRARVSVRQTPRQTTVVVTLVEDVSDRIIWSGQFAAPTDTQDYVPLQRALATRMAGGMAQAIIDSA
ncbi:winged helix-turn-helix domain-containing protein [Sphingomonas sanxanigenens]|uniref:OmpR/PhoB-type domain-containing protein n=1 Tax=Sphingomonas sanxanigenens DSM 19645 = NX02 TaxID=1123269 RepID=W0ABU8_9SPHN|nr:winged helix-turn-helix domain-containing protein [Sphingomonas sanxanigenens]AHE55404.1 hypothetical protein NX02_18675 [Sphingomonas sanxanigenens DSM 19645 = NX02]